MDDTQRLILDNLIVARGSAYRVWKTAPKALDVQELLCIANIALVEAAERWPDYCARNGYSPKEEQFFSVYAQRRTYGAIMDFLRLEDAAVGREARGNLKKLREAGLDTGASEEEMAGLADITPAKIRETLHKVSIGHTLSFELPTVDDNTLTLGESIASREDIQSDLITAELLSVVVATIREMPKEIQLLLALHYYLDMEFADIAPRLGIKNKNNLSGLHGTAVTKIHRRLLQEVADD